LFGTEYWSGLVDWIRRTLLPAGKIAAPDLDLITMSDDIGEIVARIKASTEASSPQVDAEERSVAANAAAEGTANEGRPG
jgi:hypothetical protein